MEVILFQLHTFLGAAKIITSTKDGVTVIAATRNMEETRLELKYKTAMHIIIIYRYIKL